MSILKKGSWQLFAGLVVMALGIFQLGFLTRFLSPGDFGVLAVVMVVVTIVQAISSMGLANFLVHKQEVNNDLNSTVFWMMLGAGCLLCVLVWLLSYVVEDIYGFEGLQRLIALASISFVFIGATGQLQARFLLTKQLDLLAKVDITSKIFGVLGSIILVLNDFGVTSVVWGLLITGVSRLVQLVYLAPNFWLPRFQFSWQICNESWRYGAFNVGAQLINQFRTNFDTLILGIYIGVNDLGFYSLAKQMAAKPSMLLSPAIQRLILPVFAMLQGDKAELRASVLRAHTLISFISVGVAAFLVIGAPFLLDIIYGNSYLDGVLPLFNLLVVFYSVRLVSGLVMGGLVDALGVTKKGFYWNVFSLFAQFLAVFVGAQYGVKEVCWALIIMQILLLPLSYWYFYRISVRVSILEYCKPLCLALFPAVLLLFGSIMWKDVTFGALQQLLGALSGVVIYLIYAVLLAFKFKWVSFDFSGGRL